MGVRDSSIFFPVAERIDILCRSREKGNVPFWLFSPRRTKTSTDPTRDERTKKGERERERDRERRWTGMVKALLHGRIHRENGSSPSVAIVASRVKKVHVIHAFR